MTALQNVLEKYDLGLRIALLLLLVALSFMFLLIGSKGALAMGIKSESTITGDNITLGDIFYGLPDNEDKVLGPAPQPGSDMVLNARTLLHIATALDLPWRPASTADQVVLRSAATVVDPNEIQATLEAKLKEKGAQGTFDISFDGLMPTITLPHDEPATFEVGGLNYSVKDGHFSATLFAPSMAKPIQKIPVSGKIDPMTEIPVLREDMNAGMLIGKNDIDMVQVPSRDIGAKTALRVDDLIGSTPRRIISAGKPVQLTEIEAPRIVTRGDIVTMVFHEGPLVLTAKGRALQPGAKGDVINVVNSNSSRTVQGIVSGDKEVTIDAD